jgi:uncharacterized protein YycO
MIGQSTKDNCVMYNMIESVYQTQTINEHNNNLEQLRNFVTNTPAEIIKEYYQRSSVILHKIAFNNIVVNWANYYQQYIVGIIESLKNNDGTATNKVLTMLTQLEQDIGV